MVESGPGHASRRAFVIVAGSADSCRPALSFDVLLEIVVFLLLIRPLRNLYLPTVTCDGDEMMSANLEIEGG